jgi:hypothetical protein
MIKLKLRMKLVETRQMDKVENWDLIEWVCVWWEEKNDWNNEEKKMLMFHKISSIGWLNLL